MKGILITGGLGYIGGRIADYLRKKKPNLEIFLTTRSKKRDFPHWAKGFTILQMNLLDEKSIHRCLKDSNGDTIIHLAALNEIDSMKDPQSALEVNTKGTYQLLSVAHKKGVERFIYFSTFHVYGKTSDLIITEETPIKPFHPYAITHRAAEDFVRFFQHYYKMKTLIFRLSNGYGYPMHKDVNRWTLVFNDLCRQAVTTGRIILKSSGKQYRDFISLHDVARVVYHFLFVVPDNWGDGLYNLGGNCNISILGVAQKISKIYSDKYKEEKVKIEPKSKGNNSAKINRFTYSINKLIRTGFQLQGNMNAEIVKTMEICEGFLNERNERD